MSTTYVVVMRVDEFQMSPVRKDTVLNCLTVTMVKADSLTEAHDKAITVFPPDLVERSVISVKPYPFADHHNDTGHGLQTIIDSCGTTIWNKPS